jgi:TPR repeat protein
MPRLMLRFTEHNVTSRAGMGSMYGEYALALLHCSGAGGVEQDAAAASHLFTRAALQNLDKVGATQSRVMAWFSKAL